MEKIMENFNEKQYNANSKIFDNYVKSNFDMQASGIKRKYYHTYRVAEVCHKIGKKLDFLNGRNLLLLMIIQLLTTPMKGQGFSLKKEE